MKRARQGLFIYSGQACPSGVRSLNSFTNNHRSYYMSCSSLTHGFNNCPTITAGKRGYRATFETQVSYIPTWMRKPKAEEKYKVEEEPVHLELIQKQGEWTCSNCGFANLESRVDCYRCNTDRPTAEQKKPKAQEKKETTASSDEKPSEEKLTIASITEWLCPSCGFVNYINRDDCYKCGRNKPNDQKILKLEEKRRAETK